MNAETISKLYTWAVIVLAAVAVWHISQRFASKKDDAGKHGCNRNPAPNPAQQISPTWWRPGVAIGPLAARRKTPMTLAV